MSPRLSFLLMAATPLFAQFSQLAATDDGSQVYFTTPLALYNSPAGQSYESRVYRIGPDGVSLIAQRPSFVTGTISISSASDGVTDPQVSGDGSVVGVTFRNVCPGEITPLNPPPLCSSPSSAEAVILHTPNIDLGPGVLQLSRNGRWTLVTNTNALPQGLTNVATVADHVTNLASQILNPILGPSRVLASDGSVLTQNGIWKQGQVTPLPSIEGLSYTPQSLSDNAAIVIAFAFAPGVANSIRLVAIDVPSGKATTLCQSTTSTLPLFMGMSNDGRHALYRVTALASVAGTAYVVDTATGQSTAIAVPTGELATDGTLSGDGRIAFLATTAGRILKVTLSSGTIEPLIPPTPYVGNLNQLAIGSLIHLQTSYPGTVNDWTGQILLGGRPLPVLAIKPGEVDVQVPWEVAPGVYPFQVNLQFGSPFQQLQSVFVSSISPAFEPLDPGESAIFPIQIVKGDWSGYQTTQPKAGDIVYIYMTGLGPVTGPVATGVPTPLNAVEPTQLPLTCTFTPQTTPAQTLFAGLAPGAIGIYQVAFRMPSDPNTKPLNGIQCTLGQSASFGFGIIGASVLP
jgi:uncharacterized protein (TIGR03437 family)